MTKTIWYKPEHAREAARHTCYCHSVAVGRTRYFDGFQYKYVYQCAVHLPKVGLAYTWSPDGDES